MIAAMTYVETHNLGMRLSDAMQTVMHEKPDDPVPFLSDRLSRNADACAKLSRKSTIAKKASKSLTLPEASSEFGRQRSNLVAETSR